MATPELNPAPRHPARPRTAHVASLGLAVPGAASQAAGSKRLSCVAALRDLAWLGVAGPMVAMLSRSASGRAGGPCPGAEGGCPRPATCRRGRPRAVSHAGRVANVPGERGAGRRHRSKRRQHGPRPGHRSRGATGPYRHLATPLAVSGACGWRCRLREGARPTRRGCHDPRVRRAESAGQYSAVMPWPSTTSSMRPDWIVLRRTATTED